MSVIFDEKNENFHLSTRNTSYVIHLVDSQYLQHVYWGKTLKSFGLDYMEKYFAPETYESGFSKNEFTLDMLPQEYPTYGNSDLRTPAYQVMLENGSTITDAKYFGYKILHGKKSLPGLPASYALEGDRTDTLELLLKDALCGLEMILSYTVFEDYDVITRSVRFENKGTEDLKLLRALSVNVDFSEHDFDMLQLSGAWASEFGMVKRPLVQGSQSIESRRGASSAQHNPFLALLRKNTDEDNGEVYGFGLVYSGNFVAGVEVEQFGGARAQMGINPFDFSWLLTPGESFQAPEAVMVYSDSGLGLMSLRYHRFYRERLCRGSYKEKNRPVLVNNWEATYFDFNETKIKDIAVEASSLGIELFVLDDGWFGHRNNAKSSLGDWFVDKQKLPHGLDMLAKEINGLGLKFGLWFEPEMVSPDSDLYRAHPDWCIHVPGRESSLGRNQLILDFSREDVCKAITKMVCGILSSAPIAYVKWDMNRNMTEAGSALLDRNRQRETSHRYILGLYRVLEEITGKFPDILFESCASGGGRFDPGMLYYMPQTWTSDDTDAVQRLKIQYGASLIYPAVSMGAHVAAVPNHQLGRTTPLETRGHVAMSGNFGYELDLTKLTQDEKAIVKNQVERYKQIREVVQFGDFFRMKSPFEGNETAWIFVNKEKTEAVVDYFKVLNDSNHKCPCGLLKLKGLDPGKRYDVEGMGKSFGGDELMYAGLIIPRTEKDFQSFSWRLKSI